MKYSAPHCTHCHQTYLFVADGVAEIAGISDVTVMQYVREIRIIVAPLTTLTATAMTAIVEWGRRREEGGEWKEARGRRREGDGKGKGGGEGESGGGGL